MPLEKREFVSVSRQGQTFEGVRLVFRVGQSHQLAQVIDFQGRQKVDDTIYGGEDKDRMLKNAQQLLLEMAS